MRKQSDKSRIWDILLGEEEEGEKEGGGVGEGEEEKGEG